jgi:hypothetical protein
MGLDPSLTSDIPMLVALIILFIGLYFRGLVLWISLAIALLYLYIFDRESIITLVIYGFTASLLIAGYLRIRKGLTLSNKPDNEYQFDIVIDANNLIGTANWDLKVFLKFINELERDGFKTYLFFDHSIIRLLREKGLIVEGETVPMTICRVLNRNRHNVTVSKKGHKADGLLIKYADRNKTTVLSNDKFNKFEDRFYIQSSARLKSKGLIKRVSLINGALTIM